MIACAGLVAAPSFGQTPLMRGFFGGGFGPPGDFSYTQIELEGETALAGRIYQPYERVDAPPIHDLRRDGAHLQFQAGGLAFDLRRTQTGFEGTVRPPGGRAEPAYFAIRPGTAPAALVARYEGTYDLGNGHTLSLARNTDGGSLWYLEQPSGRTGFLFNLSNEEFIVGPCVYCAGPIRMRVRFLPHSGEGLADRIAVTLDGREREVRRVQSNRTEEVAFTSRDGTRLAGTLLVPAGRGRHPAVVLVHGSGATARNGFYGHIRFMAEAYAQRGIAVLIYGKRGTGGSGGDWETAGFNLLADDAAAALAFLAGRPDIRPDRLGLSGSSQANWIIPMAASRFPTVRILQMRSGSAPQRVEEQERDRLERQMRADGLSDAEVARGMRIRTMMDAYAKTGEGWDALAAAAEEVKDEFWMRRYIGGLPARDAPDWAWLREAFGYDVTPDIRRFRGRVQVLYGGRDELFDPTGPIALMRNALHGSRVREADIEILPTANHNGLEGRIGSEREFPSLERFVPGYFDKIVEWAVRRLR